MNVGNRGCATINRRVLLAGFARAGAINALGGFSLARAISGTTGDPIALTAYGKVRGIAAKRVLSFRGGPYGGPAEGANRFMPPTAPTPWKGVGNAMKGGPRAIQTGGQTIFASPLIGDYF